MADETHLVLVVDDEPAILEILAMRIESWGFEVCTAGNAGEARTLFQERDPDLVVSDVVLPDGSGLDLLQEIQASRPRPVILVTAHGTVDAAVEALKAGARDFLTKPLDYGNLEALLEDAREELRGRDRVRSLESRLEEGGGPGSLVGASEAMDEVFHLVELVASKDASAIITGESGTGKEVVARTIHDLSRRESGPFVAVNAAAIPENLVESELFGHEKGAFTGATRSRPGCFERADGGTLLLDEIVEMPVALQPKLLRVLEEQKTRRVGGDREVEFDVRILAATNRDVQDAVDEGVLREDLYYRLAVFNIELPPLRDRGQDIPLLAQHFVGVFNEKHDTRIEGVGSEALEHLTGYAWPGNVRELRNVLERAAIVAGEGWIEPSHLPPYVTGRRRSTDPKVVLPMGISAAEAEKRLILKTLEHVDNNKAEAARRLGLNVKTIRNKLKAWGMM